MKKLNPFYVLFAVLFFPVIMGVNAQIGKVVLLAGCTLALIDLNSLCSISVAKRKVLQIGGVLFVVATLATLNATNWKAGFFGGQDRVEGLLALIPIFTFAWLAFWRVSEREQFLKFATFLEWVVGCCFALWVLNGFGWWYLERSVGTAAGVGFVMAMIVPYLLARKWSPQGESSSTTYAVCTLAATLVVASGSRSALLALVCSSFLVGFLSFDKKNFMWPIVAIVALIMISPMKDRLLSTHPSNFGQGPRMQINMDLLKSGIPFLGYGLEQQVYLINRYEGDGLQDAIYDRFHFWPSDVACSVGFFGLGLVVVIIALTFIQVYNDSWRWEVVGAGGAVLAFLVFTTFNPPSFQTMVLAAVMASACFTFSETQESTAHRYYAIMTIASFLVMVVIFVANIYFCYLHETREVDKVTFTDAPSNDPASDIGTGAGVIVDPNWVEIQRSILPPKESLHEPGK